MCTCAIIWMKYCTVDVLHENWTTLNILWGYAVAGSIPDGVIGISSLT